VQRDDQIAATVESQGTGKVTCWWFVLWRYTAPPCEFANPGSAAVSRVETISTLAAAKD